MFVIEERRVQNRKEQKEEKKEEKRRGCYSYLRDPPGDLLEPPLPSRR